MNRFGLTREYNSKKQKINNATTIDSVLSPPQQSNENNEQIERLSQIIKEKNSQIQKLQSHINELTTKIQTLEDKNSKLKSAVDNPELLLEKNRLLGMSNESLNKKVKELEEKLKALMELHLKTPNIT
jgi:chromosome segregation ATPase